MTTLYFTKKFTAGTLKGLYYIDSLTKDWTDEQFATWARKHSTKPVKAYGGSDYLVLDPSFQCYKR